MINRHTEHLENVIRLRSGDIVTMLGARNGSDSPDLLMVARLASWAALIVACVRLLAFDWPFFDCIRGKRLRHWSRILVRLSRRVPHGPESDAWVKTDLRNIDR